tara:strand:- start:757 stop:1641 length:885 start_codon:yes stop_codon:yes gene_type:complete
MYHGMKYDTKGKVIEIPGQDFIGPNHKVQSFPVVEKGNLLWIWMGDPKLADANHIHDYGPLSDSSWRGFEKEAYLHYEANWMLIVDNLADFSHLAFVHTNTLGGSEDYAFITHPEVEKLKDGFKLVRWNRNDSPAPYHAKVNPDLPEKLDRCNSVQMIVPGTFLMSTVMAPVGWDPEGNNYDGVKQYRNCQFMTPETRSTTHFFWNYLHNYRTDDPNISRSLQDSLLEGFMEDKEIIEAQQKMLEEKDKFDSRGMQGDEAFIHFRRVYDALLSQERKNYNLHERQIGNSIIQSG